jgi:hypothetical protein
MLPFALLGTFCTSIKTVALSFSIRRYEKGNEKACAIETKVFSLMRKGGCDILALEGSRSQHFAPPSENLM